MEDETYRAGGAEQGNQTGLDNVLVDTHTPDLILATSCRALDVGRGLDISAQTDRVLLVVDDVEVDAKAGEGVGKGRDGTGANTRDRVLDAVDLDDTGEPTLEVLGVDGLAGLRGSGRLGPVRGDVVVDQGEAGVGLEVVGVLEEGNDLVGAEFPVQGLRLLLDDLAELDLQSTREIQLQAAQDDPGGTALAALRVDTDDGLVVSSNILRVQGQVWHLPRVLGARTSVFSGLESLLDRILVASTEGADDELTAIRPPFVDGDLVTLFHDLNDRVDVREIDVRVDTLCVQVKGKGDQVDITRSLTVSEEGALDTVGARHLGQLCGGHGAATVVVWVKGDADLVSLRDVPTEVLNLVGVDVGRRHLDRGGEVENDRRFLRGLPGSLDSLTDLDGEVGVCVGESLGGELVTPFCAGRRWVILGDGAGELGAAHRHLDTLLLGHAKDYPTEALACGKVKVKDGLLGTLERLDCPADEVLTAWREHLQPDVIGDHARGLDEAAGEVKVRLRGGGERNLNLLVTNIDKHLEEAEFLVTILQNRSSARLSVTVSMARERMRQA